MPDTEAAERRAYAARRIAAIQRQLELRPPHKAQEKKSLEKALLRWRGIVAEGEREGESA
ncbi:MAG TPA: hypothetical protein VKV96_14100 [Roseiarcus sp.]|nr:hypothetical protein [Roseiarcus sp.]